MKYIKKNVSHTSMRRMDLLKLVLMQHLLRARSRPWTQGQIGDLLLLLLLLLNLQQLLIASLPMTAQINTMLRFSCGCSGGGGCCCCCYNGG